MISCATDSTVLLENSIAQKIGPQKYKLWFKNATRLTLADSFVRVEGPNVFVGESIERYFGDVIQASAREITGQEHELHFSIEPNLAKHLRRKQPDSQLKYAAANPERLARLRKRQGGAPAAQPGRSQTCTRPPSRAICRL